MKRARSRRQCSLRSLSPGTCRAPTAANPSPPTCATSTSATTSAGSPTSSSSFATRSPRSRTSSPPTSPRRAADSSSGTPSGGVTAKPRATMASVRTTLIVNPYASKVTPDLAAQVARALGATETVFTEHAGHATELARDADAGAVVVFSGDGGFNEVLNGARPETILGFVPGGGTSVLPRVLGLPRDPVEAARQLAAGRTRRIGLGRANGRRFGFAAGVGLDAELVRRMDSRGRRADGKRPGDAVFAWTAVKTLAETRVRFDPALDIEGHGRAAFALVANADPYSY